MIIYRLDIGKTSGFIGYADNGIAIICVNCKRPLGHQNFTLAHEIGHLFLHKGHSITDMYTNIMDFTKDELEIEANSFASELLYPNDMVKQDVRMLYESGLFYRGKELELADSINDLVNRYCISFRFGLVKILFATKSYDKNTVKEVSRAIKRASGGLIKRYGPDMYANDGTENNRIVIPLGIIEDLIKNLTSRREISFETGESILDRFRELGD